MAVITADGPRSPFGVREIVRFRRAPLEFVAENARRFGDVASFRLGRRLAYQVNHPDLVRELLVTNAGDHLRGPLMQRARAVMGSGLLTSEEPLHTEQRRTLQPLFHRERLATYADTIETSARTFAGWRDGESIDVRTEMLRLSLDIVGRSLFGADLRDDARRIAEAVNAFMLMMDAVFFPWPDQFLRLPFPPMRRFHRGMSDLDEIIGRLIAAPDEGSGGMAGWLLRSGHGPSWRRQVRDECVTFLLAGHETVANALTFAILLIAQRPDVAARLADETVACASLPSADRYERLRYTRAVLAESMRLYPPVWILARQTKAASTIGSQRVPPGTVIFVSQWVIHRDDRFFTEPLRFAPERFLEPVVPRHAYFPFGAGPRQCIGESFAWMEGTLVLAEIVRRWHLQLMTDAEPALTAKVTLRPAAPVIVRVTTRSTAPR